MRKKSLKIKFAPFIRECWIMSKWRLFCIHTLLCLPGSEASATTKGLTRCPLLVMRSISLLMEESCWLSRNIIFDQVWLFGFFPLIWLQLCDEREEHFQHRGEKNWTDCNFDASSCELCINLILKALFYWWEMEHFLTLSEPLCIVHEMLFFIENIAR